MSNKLIRLAQRVTMLAIGGETRAIWPSEKAVLVCLADDARDADGGVAKLPIAEIAVRTGINRRTVEVALRHLSDAGLITRDGGPGRATASTRLRLETPVETTARPGVDSDQTRIHTGSDPNPHRIRPESDSGPSFTNRPIDHSTSAGAAKREVAVAESGQAETAMLLLSGPTPDPVDQVFDAWDLMAKATGLPGPVRRDVERRQAIERRIAGEKLWRVLQAVRAIPDAPYLARRRARPGDKNFGQGDVMADFDFVFGVGHLRGNRVFERLLEGSFTGGRAVPVEEFGPPPVQTGPPPPFYQRDEPDDIRALRAAMRARLGDALARQWIDPLQLRWERDGSLLVIAPGAFQADWVNSHYAGQLRSAAGGAMVRIVERERV